MDIGKKHWVFADGDLPPKDGGPMEAHEALMVVNMCREQAVLDLMFLFEDQPPVEGVRYTLEPQRVMCIRMDKPLGDSGYRLPFGQYALYVSSSVPVVAVFGRLDTRQANLAYYPVQGYSV